MQTDGVVWWDRRPRFLKLPQLETEYHACRSPARN